jgi:hypothetical protein
MKLTEIVPFRLSFMTNKFKDMLEITLLNETVIPFY